MKTLKDKLYEAIKNLNDADYKEFYFEWFGADNLWDNLRESIDSVDKDEWEAGIHIIKDIEEK